jgi:hypothetical protein
MFCLLTQLFSSDKDCAGSCSQKRLFPVIILTSIKVLKICLMAKYINLAFLNSIIGIAGFLRPY